MGPQERLLLDRIGGTAGWGFVVEECFGGGVDFVVQHEAGDWVDGEGEDVHARLHVGSPMKANIAALAFEPRHAVVVR